MKNMRKPTIGKGWTCAACVSCAGCGVVLVGWIGAISGVTLAG